MAIAENHLIELLPRKERRRLLAICERIELVLGEVLGAHGSPTRNVYFPTEGFISLVTPLDGKPVLKVGMVGREGMWGAHLAQGVVTDPLQSLVQGSGAAWRIGARAFHGEFARSAALQRSIHRYIYLARSATCNGSLNTSGHLPMSSSAGLSNMYTFAAGMWLPVHRAYRQSTCTLVDTARCDRCAIVTAYHHLDATVQLPSAGVHIIRHWEPLPVALASNPRWVYASRYQRRLDGVGALLREILVIRVRADTVGKSVDLHTPLGMVSEKLR